jgi:hydroxybutyrate-dimer hydrolase
LSTEFLISPVRATAHRGGDDLLSAGLGLAGLRDASTAFADAIAPTPAELRRRAIQTAWKGIAHLGDVRAGDLATVPGREYQAFAKLPNANSPHRVLVQVPDAFDAKARCLVVTASSGSRGIYGAIALAGAWGLPRGCAVAYTDKGAGSGYFDCASATGVTLDGTRAIAGEAELEFVPDVYAAGSCSIYSGIAVKHAHSGDNPEADWGRHVLQAAEFGLAMLDRALPLLAPFTPQNTRIIAVGLSNGGAAVLQAAGLDGDGWLDAAVVIAPNVNVPGHGRALYDYATEAALLLPCALADPRFDNAPFARTTPAWVARGASLHAVGILHAASAKAQTAEALERLHADGWSDAALAGAASVTAFDLWRAFAATYASAYTRSAVGQMPGGFRFAAHDAQGRPCAATLVERAAWWADAGGIPPGAGVFLDKIEHDETKPADPNDPALCSLLVFRDLWTNGTVDTAQLRASVAATQVRLPRADLPIWLVHGLADGLIPAAFSSEAYVAWLRANGREPMYSPVPHAQHFDAFLALPGFGERYVPLLPYAYTALDQAWQHLASR